MGHTVESSITAAKIVPKGVGINAIDLMITDHTEVLSVTVAADRCHGVHVAMCILVIVALIGALVSVLDGHLSIYQPLI